MGLRKRVKKIGKEDVEHNWERFWCDRQNLTSRFNWERFLAPSRRPPVGGAMSLRDSEMPVGLVYPRRRCLG